MRNPVILLFVLSAVGWPPTRRLTNITHIVDVVKDLPVTYGYVNCLRCGVQVVGGCWPPTIALLLS